MQEICQLFGITRQAHYKYLKHEKVANMQAEIVIKLVEEIRADLPRTGVAKLHFLLQDQLKQHHIKMGRDKLANLLSDYGMLIRMKKRKPFTTDSNHMLFKYANLIVGMQFTRINQVWVSDITYIRVDNEFAYLSLITDAFSRMIIGYCLRMDLTTEGPLTALQMALQDYNATNAEYLIHHSDRGRQYCSADYIATLREYFIAISMTQKGDPYENAIAERVNGILKTEFKLHITFRNFKHAEETVACAIRNYNTIRPHMSLDFNTPYAVYHRYI